MHRSNSGPEQRDLELGFYAAHGPITEPGEWGSVLRRLPGDMRALCRAVQGNLGHVY